MPDPTGFNQPSPIHRRLARRILTVATVWRPADFIV
jgi:hypothetical protein